MTAGHLFDLSGLRALVTGASGGIGRAIARALRAQGAELVLTGRRADRLEELAAELGGASLVVAGDLTAAGFAEQLVERAEREGGLDILVHNAGVTRDALLLRMREEAWREVLETNLTAAFRLARAALRGMMRRRFGRILHIGSVVGTTGNPGQTNYAASKAGLVGFTKALAQEVAGRGITVNCIAPGFIDTPMTRALDERQREALLARIPNGRLGTAEEVAAAAVFLASREAGYITGHTLHVNGGMVMV